MNTLPQTNTVKFPFDVDNIRTLITNTPKVTKNISLAIIILFLIGRIFPSLTLYLALIPGFSIPPHFYVWNIITSGYYEIYFIHAVVNAVTVLLFGKYLEPIWGSKEFIKFIVIVNSLCGLTTFLLMVFAYPFFRDPAQWFALRLCGFSGAIAGFTVATKQLIPEQEINLFNSKFLRAKHLPAISLGISGALWILGLTPEAFPFTVFGFIISWIYLRFFQVKIADGSIKVIGDMSESFSFASFFPEPLHPPIRVVSTIVFRTLKACQCCNGVGSSDVNKNNLYGTDIDSERRRQRALRALDQRIQMQDIHQQNTHADIVATDRMAEV